MSNAAEQALLDLLFLNTDWANVGDAGGIQNSAAAGVFYVGLHSADPGEAGDQTENEAAHTGYNRIAVARSGAGWTRSGSTISNAAVIQFDECTAGSTVATHFSVGVGASGATAIVFSGSLAASRSISAGITPIFNTGELDVTVD